MLKFTLIECYLIYKLLLTHNPFINSEKCNTDDTALSDFCSPKKNMYLPDLLVFDIKINWIFSNFVCFFFIEKRHNDFLVCNCFWKICSSYLDSIVNKKLQLKLKDVLHNEEPNLERMSSRLLVSMCTQKINRIDFLSLLVFRFRCSLH